MSSYQRRCLLYLLVLKCVYPSVAYTLSVFPVTYQSHNLTFSDWITILTLCFAPLLAHIIAGTPEVVYLGPRKHLTWYRRLCQYNATTILWRYFAIADRRIRAKEWDAYDFAASNALFWTSHGWNDSEEMIEKARMRSQHLVPGLQRYTTLDHTPSGRRLVH